nr:hypothetical protein [Tanacetum cinerariifolium]
MGKIRTNDTTQIKYASSQVKNANLKWRELPSMERHAYCERLSKLQLKEIGTPRVADWSMFYVYSFDETLKELIKFEYLHSDGDVFTDYSWERALSIKGDVYPEWCLEFFSTMCQVTCQPDKGPPASLVSGVRSTHTTSSPGTSLRNKADTSHIYKDYKPSAARKLTNCPKAGPTTEPITPVNQTPRNNDNPNDTPSLQDHILDHISSLKSLIKEHNERFETLTEPIRLTFGDEGKDDKGKDNDGKAEEGEEDI